jgi:hypothetical protein
VSLLSHLSLLSLLALAMAAAAAGAAAAADDDAAAAAGKRTSVPCPPQIPSRCEYARGARGATRGSHHVADEPDGAAPSSAQPCSINLEQRLRHATPLWTAGAATPLEATLLEQIRPVST